MTEIANIDLLGNVEEQHGSGSVKSQQLDFHYHGQLAGGQQPPKSGDTLQKFKKIIGSALGTAKDVKLGGAHKLPWQYDSDGKLYSTEVEQLRFKCEWLRGEITRAGGGTDDAPSTRDDIELQALYNTYYPLKLELQLIEAEAKFRRKLFCWILGEGTAEEYIHCPWLGKRVVLSNGLEVDLGEIDQQLAGDYWLDTNTQEDLKWKRLEITQTLLRTYPGLSQGMIDQDDKLVLKAKVFIDYLKRKMPKNDEGKFI